MALKLYDLKKDNSDYLRQVFESELEYIRNSDKELKDNYDIQALKLDSMLTFDILIDTNVDRIVSMSGLQRITDDMARVSSRYYFSDLFSEPWIRDNKRFRPNWEYFIPNQIKVARENNISKLFWGMEQKMSDRFFQKISDVGEEFLKEINCTTKVLPGRYNVFSTKKRISQIILNEKPDVTLDLSPWIEQKNDTFFYEYKDFISNLLEKHNVNINNSDWTADDSVIKIANLTEYHPNHPIINHLKENYYEEIFKVMVARVYDDIPEHRDSSPEARQYPMHMKILMNGDWSGFFIKNSLFGTITECNNNNNTIVFDNELHTHYVKDTMFDVIIPYGILK